MTHDEKIEHMITRFLQWKLPHSFNPDGGISFDRTYISEHGPVGTNLLDYEQAKAMVLHMVEGLPVPVNGIAGAPLGQFFTVLPVHINEDGKTVVSLNGVEHVVEGKKL